LVDIENEFRGSLKAFGIKIGAVTLAEGNISEIHIGLKGTMNVLFLKDLADKTRRGLRGRIEKGKSGGGLCYGYRVMKKLDRNGDTVRGDREIVECWRALTASHRSSGTMRSSGTSVLIQAEGGLGRETRFPVAGSLMKRCRFHTSMPT
jgi:hypothetical protein